MRAFISINIPEEVAREIRKIQDKLPRFYGKKTELENLHLTLKFLGEVNEKKIQKIKKKLRGIQFEKFETRVDSIGVFSEKLVRIIWISLIACGRLQKAVDRKISELGFSLEKRFMGHLTIARVKNIRDKKKFLEELKKIKIPKMNFMVKEFYLMKSELKEKGPEYSVLEKYELK